MRVGLEDNNYYEPRATRDQPATGGAHRAHHQGTEYGGRQPRARHAASSACHNARAWLPDAGAAHVAVVGTGVIGASWASVFLAAGPGRDRLRPGARCGGCLARRTVAGAMADHGRRSALLPAPTGAACAFHPTRREPALEGADFVQEIRARAAGRQAARLFAAMAEATPGQHGARLLLLHPQDQRRVQGGCRHPERIVLGHPFNPPHLIPLVEIVGGDSHVGRRRWMPRWRFTARSASTRSA